VVKDRRRNTDEIRPKSKPFIDIKEQAALGAEVPPARDVAREVFEMLSETADVLLAKDRKRGALIVIGNFASMGEVKGARARPPNPFEGLYLSARDKAFQRMLLQDPALEDGAVVVDTSGQVLGGRIYFFVENADNVEIPEGCFARHIAAAVTSLRDDVETVITLSEEQKIARVFRNGKVVEEYDPSIAAAAIAAKEAEAAEKAARAMKRKRKKNKKKKADTALRKKRKADDPSSPPAEKPSRAAKDASSADARAKSEGGPE
jgi:hypothetical protein